jgi:small subunit ribosomal protein S9
MADEPQDTPQDEPAPEEPTAEQPAAEEPEATPEQPEAAADPEADAPAEEPEAPAEDAPAAEEAPAAEAEEPAETEAAAEPEASEEPAEKPKPKRKKDAKADDKPDVIPGAHLEPDLVLEEKKTRADETGYVGAEVEIVEEVVVVEGEAAAEGDSDEDEAPAKLEAVLNLAADARYRATGKRKSAVARVTLKPGTGEYTINGKSLNEYFPRATLQTKARLPLETVGQQDRMDVVAKIHGGGVSAQAGALRHGITRALVEADPNLRGELKRRGFLTRDPRVKERKKAGLKKARKRPQFSKR